MDWLLALSAFALGWRLRGWATPARLVALHRRAARVYWRWRSRRRGPGRPQLDPALIALIARISAENPLWGAPRIHGELLKLGFRLAQSTVSKYMAPRRGRPTQSWTTFLRNQAGAIAAIDLFTAPTLTLGRLYAFVVLAHDRRRILYIEVAKRPTALWLAHKLRSAFDGDTHAPHSACSECATPCHACVSPGARPAILVRDNDRLYGRALRDEIRALGLDDRPTQIASPWQNGHAERLIGSIRRECLDHVIVINAAHLRRLLAEYAAYYNSDRTHLALDKDAPLGRRVEARGRVVSRPVLGGLHRRYGRKAR